MGSPLSHSLTNAFLCHYEKIWPNECPLQLKHVVYRCYVDSIFVLFQSKQHLKLFVNYTNSKQKNIKFAIEAKELPPTDISIPNISCEFCPKDDNARGSLISIRNHLSYKTRNDLKIYKSFELESTFIEICNPMKMNIIIGCFCKHQNMKINEFNDDYLNKFLSFLVNYLNKIKLYFFFVTLTLAC